MTAIARSRRLPLWFGALLLALFTGAAVVGAYLDWLWWHPTQGIVVTLAAIGLLVVAGAMSLFRRPFTNRLALGALAIGAGLLIGQAVGPSREAPMISTGTMTVRVDRPITSEATGPATCQTVPSGEQFQVSGDANARLPLSGVDEMEYPFVFGNVSVGDMWAPSFGRRDDDLGVSLYLNAARVTEEFPTEAWLQSDPSSALDAQFDGKSGSVGFSGLIVTQGDVRGILGAEGQVTGKIEWSCRG